MAPELVIRLRGAVKRYGEIAAVDGPDLDVPVATCVGLLGANGAVKATTMRLLAPRGATRKEKRPVFGGFSLWADPRCAALSR